MVGKWEVTVEKRSEKAFQRKQSLSIRMSEMRETYKGIWRKSLPSSRGRENAKFWGGTGLRDFLRRKKLEGRCGQNWYFARPSNVGRSKDYFLNGMGSQWMILSKGMQIPGYQPSLLSSPLGESPLHPQSRNSQRERQIALIRLHSCHSSWLIDTGRLTVWVSIWF